MNFLLFAIKKNIPLFIGILLIISVGKISLILPPVILGRIVDAISSPSGFDLALQWRYIALFLAAGFVQAFIAPMQAAALTGFVQRAVRDASLQWSQQILGKEFFVFETMRLGSLIKGLERGMEAHEKLLHYIIITILPLLIQAVIFSILVFFIGGAVTLPFILLGCAVYLLITHYIIIWRRPHIDAVNACEDRLVSEFATLFNAAKIVKLERAVKTAIKPLEAAYKNYAKAAIRTAYSGSFLTASQALSLSCATAVILIWGLLDQTSAKASISAGDLVILFSASASLFASVIQIGESYRFMDQFRADRKQLAQFLSLPDFSEHSAALPVAIAANAALTLEPGCISTAAAEPVAIENPLTISAGEKIAIIGASGAGKTTLLEALAGISRNIRPRLHIGAHGISSLSGEQHLSLLRYAPQQAQFLEGNMEHAVFFGCGGADISPAFRKMQLDGFLENRGRIFSEGGANISGGEGKRLSLLRLLRRPGLFNFFDEPTASLDPKLAEPVWEALFNYIGDKALIAATHDMRNLARFDRVIIMQKGRIIADGAAADIIRDMPLQKFTGSAAV